MEDLKLDITNDEIRKLKNETKELKKENTNLKRSVTRLTNILEKNS